MKPSIENTRMQRESVSKLGGVCSGLMGISYLLVGIIYFLQPAAQRTSIASTDENLLRFYLSMAQSPAAHTILHALLALISVLAFAAVPAISTIVRSRHEAWQQWATKLAYLGFASFAMYNFRAVHAEYAHAKAIAAADPVNQLVLLTSAKLIPTDWYGFLSYGCVGLWIIATSVFGLASGAFPRLLAYVGIAFGVMYWLLVCAYLVQITELAGIANGIGAMLLGPVWFIWIGMRLAQGRGS